MTNLVRDLNPTLARADAGAVLVGRWPLRHTPPMAVTTAWENRPWPEGLVSVNVYVSTDGQDVLVYEQWADEPDGPYSPMGAEPVAYRLYRSGLRENAPVPGCVVIVSVEFDGPDRERQERWVDTVFAALAAETDLHPGGISGHFHTSLDGTRVLNYAEWTDEASHQEALDNSGRGTVGSTPEWLRVLEFPGVRRNEFRRYHLHASLARTGPTGMTG
ncbi:antibiotic biosynthesis monooxygenase [Streptosporangium sp. NPDC049376]|uniref:antibiotic biosynthesis monooxygenase n=1 Tax=Streptosporangium sp. NPDC049376 TaxID=3366192 RepID=UPI0037A14F46